MSQDKRTPSNRRSFLRSVGAVGLAGLPVLHSSPTPANSQAHGGSLRKVDPQAELRIGMIGIYGHTNIVLDAIPEIQGARLVAYALNDGERLPEAGVRTEDHHAVSMEFKEIKRHRAFRSDTKVYETYQEMLQKEKLDIVGTCLQFTLNVHASIAAANKGIHVISEKPLATNLEDLAALEAVVQRTGVDIIAMLDMRLYPGIRTVRETVSKGLIGEPILVTAQKSYKFGDDRPWFYRRSETYGGTIPWIGIHAIDFIMYTTGLKVTQIAAMQGNKSHPGYPGTEDHAGILLRLSNAGTAVVSLDYLRPKAAASHGDDRLRVIGSKGVVEMRRDKVELVTQDAPLREVPLLPYQSLFADFVASLRGQRAPAIRPEEALGVTRVCLLARQAASEQQIVSI